MATIHPFPAARKLVHYAVYRDVEGTAELVNGSGYLFRPDDTRKAVLVHYTDPALVLAGRQDIADGQRLVDGNSFAARVCGY